MTNKGVIIERLLQQNQQQAEQIQLLTQENQTLRERITRLEKNSSNSSKPPSSDIVNPKPPTQKGCKRKRGGQLGHKKYSRQPFTPEQIDETIIHELSTEEVNRRNLKPLGTTESALQQIDLPEKLYAVIDHRVRLYEAPNGMVVKAKLPKEIRKEGLFTSPMTAFVGYLKARCHMSYSTIEGLFNDIVAEHIFHFLTQSLKAHYANTQPPSILPLQL